MRVWLVGWCLIIDAILKASCLLSYLFLSSRHHFMTHSEFVPFSLRALSLYLAIIYIFHLTCCLYYYYTHDYLCSSSWCVQSLKKPRWLASFQLSGGKLVYSTTSNPTALTLSTEVVNDGQWHNVLVTWKNDQIVMSLDYEKVKVRTKLRRIKKWDVIEKVFCIISGNIYI